MKLHYFGDSYDVVKQSLLRWLKDEGPWGVHPMFTEPVEPAEATAFARFLDAPLLETEQLTSQTPRTLYLQPARSWAGGVFLDPDTGLRLEELRGAKASAYLFIPELVSIVRGRPGRLTLVFDQCLPRGGEAASLAKKFAALSAHGVYAIAYASHACFVLASDSRDRLEGAVETLLARSNLPSTRIVGLEALRGEAHI